MACKRRPDCGWLDLCGKMERVTPESARNFVLVSWQVRKMRLSVAKAMAVAGRLMIFWSAAAELSVQAASLVFLPVAGGPAVLGLAAELRMEVAQRRFGSRCGAAATRSSPRIFS